MSVTLIGINIRTLIKCRSEITLSENKIIVRVDKYRRNYALARLGSTASIFINA